MKQLRYSYGSGIVGALVPSVIGAVILLLILRLVRRAAG
jgi:uncharacterized membrane protein YeaQ/YmgE (transglycosylase-associated protein family)